MENNGWLEDTYNHIFTIDVNQLSYFISLCFFPLLFLSMQNTDNGKMSFFDKDLMARSSFYV